MDEIAAEARTSKTVIYRHLGDRLGLYLAVCARVDRLILRDVEQALAGADPNTHTRSPRQVLAAVIDSYLTLVEHDPEVYRFVTRSPQIEVPRDADPVVGLTTTIAERLTELLTMNLRDAGRDQAGALVLAHGLVGFVRESADHWVTDPNRQPRAVILSQLTEFAAAGLCGLLEHHQGESL